MTSRPWSVRGPLEFQLSDAANTWDAAALAVNQAGYEVKNVWDERTETLTMRAQQGGVVLTAARWPTLAGLAAIVASRGTHWAADTANGPVGTPANMYDVLVDLSTQSERWIATALFEIATTPLPTTELHRYVDAAPDLDVLPSTRAMLTAGVPRQLRWSGGLIFEALPNLRVAPSDTVPLPKNLDFDIGDRLVVFGRLGADPDLVAVYPATGHVWCVWEHGVFLASASIEAFCIGARVMQRALAHAVDLEPLAAIPFMAGVTHGLQALDPVVHTGYENIWEVMAR